MPKMTFLEELCKQMRDARITQCPFTYTFRNVDFKVVFDTQTTPFALLFCVPKVNLFFFFNVERGFNIIRPQLDQPIDNQLARLLGLHYVKDNPFSIDIFLQIFNCKAQVPLNSLRQATYRDRIPFYSDVEEADKKFFQKWLVHHGERRVTENNLDKTRKWLGEVAYKSCKQRNISSCWTANEGEEGNPKIMP